MQSRIDTLVGSGEKFETVDDVRSYFTPENISGMFGGCEYSHRELSAMADAVIDGKNNRYAYLWAK